MVSEDEKNISGVSNFLYSDNVFKIITDMPINNNILNDYDNVTYHFDLFAYSKKTQNKIDEKLADEGIYEPNKDKRIYICKDGVTTKFHIDSLTMKSVIGNHQNPLNVTTYQINFVIKETFSCLLSHELDTMGKLSGYDSYLQRPYWLEIWFSGYNKATGLPIQKIILPNGEDSIIFQGQFGSMNSHIESFGTTWEVDFRPNYSSLLEKNTNILNVSSSFKNESEITFKNFLKKCIDDMFNRFIEQITQKEDKNGKERIRSFYNAKIINDENPGTPDEKKTDKSSNNERNKVEKYSFDTIDNKFITIEIKDKNGKNFYNVDDIKSKKDSSKKDSPAHSEESNADKTMTFTDICQKFLFNTEKHNFYIAKYDIKSKILGYYNNNPLISHKIVIYLVEDIYMRRGLLAFKNNNTNFYLSDYEAEIFVRECIGNGTLVKKYQYGFSGEDISILSIDNKYDKLYYMEALPIAAQNWIDSNVQLLNQVPDKNKNEDEKQDENEEKNKNKSHPIMFYNDKSYIDKLIEFGGENLEDVFRDMDKSKVASAVRSYNRIPLRNNNLSMDNRRLNSSSDSEESRETIAATMLWKNLYKSGQLCTTKFTILGDPYWISINAYRTKKHEKIVDNKTVLSIAPNIPDYRCVFIIKSTAEQNDFYTSQNPSDFTFENSIYASGIYVVTTCESIFENGKFIQKLQGFIDVRLLKPEN